MVSSPLPQ
jgi:hypothetical protein